MIPRRRGYTVVKVLGVVNMNVGTAIGSSIGRKIINGITGLFFVGFVIGHLTGNFLLFAGPDAFNSYAHFLTNLFHGAGLLIVEAVMLLFLAMHAWSGITVWLNKWSARSKGYSVKGHATGSRKSLASTSMLYTGILLLVFIVFHVAQFKFGLTDPRPPADHEVIINGVEIENLYGRVVDTFAQPFYTAIYMIIMAMLGTHLWHGTWSAFQSLGLANQHFLPTIRKIGHVLAVLLAVGFLALPGVIFAQNDYFQEQDQAYIAAAREQMAGQTHSATSPVEMGE